MDGWPSSEIAIHGKPSVAKILNEINAPEMLVRWCHVKDTVGSQKNYVTTILCSCSGQEQNTKLCFIAKSSKGNTEYELLDIYCIITFLQLCIAYEHTCKFHVYL